MDLRQQIEEIVSRQLSGSEFFIVDIIISGVKTVPKISILLDGDRGISIDKCAEVSRRVGKQIDDNALITSAYTLEVSSPGIDQPLKLFRQYPKHIGRKVKVLLTDGSTRTGKLEAVNESSIVLAEEQKTKKNKAADLPSEIPVKDLEKTFVLVSFN